MVRVREEVEKRARWVGEVGRVGRAKREKREGAEPGAGGADLSTASVVVARSRTWPLSPSRSAYYYFSY